jgi:predicted nucleotidyltransferase
MKGEVQKLKIKPLIMDDIFTKDGLEAVSVLTDKTPYYVVGGMATQSYIPTPCRRPTSDIDLSIVRPLNYQDFKDLSKPVLEFLQDNGYEVETKKASRAFKLDVRNKEGEGLLIEFSRRNEKSFNDSRKHLERELAHAKRKIVEGKNVTYSVATPEDIVIPKLVRSIGSLTRHPYFKEYIPKRKLNLFKEDIAKKLDFINQLREDSMYSPKDLELFEKLKFISDMFDIRILSEIAGINEEYFNESSEDWGTLDNYSFDKNGLFNFILPQFVNH